MPFEIVRNDITQMRVDAIVNAANESLLGGGGVDGAIHRAAGPELLEECRKLKGCRTGEAKLTRGYRLPAKYVIHTVGPVWHGGSQGEEALLTACYRNSLELALSSGCESVAFPLISAGVYGYPKDQAVSVAVAAISRFLTEHEMMVYLVVYGREEFLTGRKLFRDVKEYIDDVYAEEHLLRRPLQGRGHLEYREPLDGMSCDAVPAPVPEGSSATVRAPSASTGPDWERMLRQTDESFSQALLRLIDEKGMTDAECYKRANVDRKLFSKIRSNPDYRPGKPTASAFAVALRLSLPEAEQLLRKAGFALSHSSRFDIVLEYFLTHRMYDIYQINEVLFEFDLPLLGSGVH